METLNLKAPWENNWFDFQHIATLIIPIGKYSQALTLLYPLHLEPLSPEPLGKLLKNFLSFIHYYLEHYYTGNSSFKPLRNWKLFCVY